MKKLLILVGLFAQWGTGTASAAVTQTEIRQIGVEAYHYLYPLALMDVTRRVLTNMEAGQRPGAGPANAFSHLRQFPDASFRDVVRPNFDTLYSIAWLDLTKEPMILSVPDTQGRYYLMPLLDMWTDVFAVPGKRTTGTGPGHFAVVPPNWKGTLPKGVSKISAPTKFVWIVGRTQTNGASDYPNVHKIQDQYQITPLSQWGKTVQPPKVVFDPGVDMGTDPMTQVQNMNAEKFFNYVLPLLKKNPPHITDWSLIARMKRIGLVPGQSQVWKKLSSQVRNGLEGVPEEGLKQMREKTPTLARAYNGWQMNTDTMGVYGNFYLKRAIVAQVGLGANQPQDAIYPLNFSDADGNPVVGEQSYVIHFSKEQLPPVDAFWSITMYDAEGFPVANPLNRFAIGDRDALTFNSDGSLDIYIQHGSPGRQLESNWLPGPATGKLGLTMRLYAPRSEVLDGRWLPPALQKRN